MPGDIVLLNAGNIIPGDCLILDSKDLFVDEAALTGESFPAEKRPGVLAEETPLGQRTNALFMGMHVISGDATWELSRRLVWPCSRPSASRLKRRSRPPCYCAVLRSGCPCCQACCWRGGNCPEKSHQKRRPSTTRFRQSNGRAATTEETLPSKHLPVHPILSPEQEVGRGYGFLRNEWRKTPPAPGAFHQPVSRTKHRQSRNMVCSCSSLVSRLRGKRWM